MPYTSAVDVLLLLVRDGQVLLALREGTGYADGYWNLPSGKLEAGEDLISALLRETREEIGIELNRDTVRHAATVHHRNAQEQARVGVFFTADTDTDAEPVNAEPHKCARLGWFPPDALPENTYSYTAAGIACWEKGEAFTLDGWKEHAQPAKKSARREARTG